MIALRAVLLAVFVAAMWLSIGPARAEEPSGGDGAGTALHPGVNLVGWVGEATSVSQIFREIPQLESVWAWDSQLDKWLVAGRDTPPGLGSLRLLTAGMGLRLHIGGEQPVVWRRSIEPTRGLVRLWTGWNLVAWSGPDGAPLEQVAKGIGWSLRSVQRWDAANQQWMAWTSPERSAQLIAASGSDPKAGMQRGEALWVEVARAVNWPQPTGVMPRIEFQDGVSEEVRTRVRQDLQAALSYFGEQYGIQADPSLHVFVEGQDRGGGSAGGNKIYLALSSDRRTVIHEYFHVLQEQLSGSSTTFRSFLPAWLSEGSAEWAASDSRVFEGKQPLESLYLRSLADPIWSGEPVSLRDSRLVAFFNAYYHGRIAVGRLAVKSGTDSWVEFWRRLAPNDVPDHPRWTSSLDWRTAFHEVFDISSSDFYAEFEVWRPDAMQRLLRNVLDLSAEANATQDRSGGAGGDYTTAAVWDLRWNDLTPGWSDDWKNELDQYFAGLVGSDDVTERVLADIRNSVETIVNFDGWRLDAALASDDAPSFQGHVVDSAGDPVSGVVVLALRTDDEEMNERILHTETTKDGQFDLRLPGSGEYRLGVDLGDGCALHLYDDGELVQNWGRYLDLLREPVWMQAKPVRVDTGTVRRVNFALPADACGWKIRGRVVTSDGEPLSSVRLYACSDTLYPLCGGSYSTVLPRTAPDGSFVVTAEATGEYYLKLFLNNGSRGEGCLAYYHTRGATTTKSRATVVSVARADVNGITVTIPATLCRWQVTGKITGAGDRLLNGGTVRISGREGARARAHVYIGRDGSFAVTAPGEGTYSFEVQGIHGTCRGSARDWQEKALIARVEQGDAYVEGSVPSDLCELWIQGSITGLQATRFYTRQGTGFVSACEVEADECVKRGSSTGVTNNSWFYFGVPTSGAYSLRFDRLDGCTIWFTAEGFTTNSEERATFHVEGGDLQLGARQIPEGICAGQ